jgi:PAS domain S-box-containing protein
MKQFLFSLRFRLILLVLLAVLPALGLALYTGLEGRRQAAVQAQENTLRLARLMAKDQERLVEGADQLLNALARLPAIRDRDPVACNALFADLMTQAWHYANFVATAPDGEVFCSGEPLSGPVNFADRAWFQQALATHDFVVGDYVIGRITGQPLLVFAHPALDEAGQVQAVVSTGLDLAWLGQLAAEAQLPAGSAFTIVDRDGTVLARNPAPQEWVGRTLPAEPLIQAMLASRNEGTVETDGLDGAQRLYGFAPARGGLYVAIGIPVQAAYAQANRALAQHLLGLGLVAVLALAAAWMGGEAFLLRRVRDLVGVARRLSAGDLGARTGRPYGVGELSQLARAFDSMAQALQQRETEQAQMETRLRAGREQYHLLFDTMLDGFALHEIICDERGRPCDYRFLEVNPAFEALTGLRAADVVGKTVLEALPSTEAHWIGTYGRVALSRESARFENYSAALGKHFEVVAYSPRPGQFATIFSDVTDRVQAEAQLRRQNAVLNAINRVFQEAFTCETEEAVAHTCLAVAEELTGSAFGFVGELNPAGLFDTVAISNPGWDACTLPGSEATALIQGMAIRGIDRSTLREGESRIVNDPASHPDRVGTPEGHPAITAFLGVPLKQAGRTVGLIGLANKEGGYTPDDQQAVEDLSVAFVEALLRKQADTTLQKRASQLALLNDVGSRLASVLDLEGLLERVVGLVHSTLGYQHVGLFTLDRERGAWLMRARAGDFAHLLPLDHRIPMSQGLVGWVGRQGETLLVNDVAAEPHYRDFSGAMPTGSELSLPLRVGDEIVGVLDVQSEERHAFDENDVLILETLAGQVAVALENARLFQAEHEQRELAEALAEAAAAIGSTLDLDQVLDRILEQVDRVIPGDAANVMLIEGDQARIARWRGYERFGVQERIPAITFSLAETAGLRRMRDTGNPLLIPDTAAEPGWVQVPGTEWIQSYLAAPIHARERVTGFLSVDSATPGFFTPAHAERLRAFADQASVAIHNAYLFDEVTRRNEALSHANALLAALSQVAVRLGASADPGQVLHTLDAELQKLSLDYVVALLEPESKTLSIYHTSIADEAIAMFKQGSGLDLRDLQVPYDHWIGEQVIHRRQPLFAPDLLSVTATLLPDVPRPLLDRIFHLARVAPTMAAFCLPLVAAKQVIGGLAVWGPDLQEEDAAALSVFASQVATALNRARLEEERQVLEEQFRQAQKLEAVGRLAGGVAHDFNNLLTVIHLSSRLLEKKLHPEDPLWQHVQRIQDAGRRATDLTKQLLAFSRREIIEPKVLDLNELLGDLSKMLRRLLGEDVELALALAENLWPVHADPTQVEQVIMNLAVNARDAMPGGGVLTLETDNVVLDAAYTARHLDVEPGEYMLLAVSDNGVGMGDEVKAHLFEPFFTTKEKGKGTGLGLSTVFGIVKQNRGHVWVYSEVGQGTTFKIYLPRSREADVWKPPALPVDAEARGSETILLVEDDAAVRDLAVHVLKMQGYQVLAAAEGPEALQIAIQHDGPIHLLLSDVVMPYMSGRELADRLRSRQPQIRVLYMSGYTDNAIVHHGVLEAGIAFLSKPLTEEGLLRKVRAVLDASE